MQQATYFNTTSLKGEELENAVSSAKALKEIIRDIYLEHPEPKTPFEVESLLVKGGYRYPLTSIRARINTLEDQDFLLKSESADKVGGFGAKNHTWKLNVAG